MAVLTQANLAEDRTMTHSNRAVTLHTVTPYLMVTDADGLIAFVTQAFAATETLRTTGSAGGIHAEVIIGDSTVMIGGSAAREPWPAALYLYLPDVDAVYRRALEAGGASIMEPSDQPYGDRLAGVKDPFGNLWYLATHRAVATYRSRSGGGE
jgi:PhnB protein